MTPRSHAWTSKHAPAVDVITITVFGERICDHASVIKGRRAMKPLRKILIASRILLLAGMSFATPAAAATFDGAWNVQIASTNSACPSGTSVSIDINNGQVASNNAMVTASGRVADAGTISVTLSSGMKRAVGSGRLTATSGSGTWRGAMCSGTWTAQRI
ncbi:hypothetical protein [Bradyrhizobium sp.]|uniref:hypothetical protein n=1 Tax=Bradyrhizobium sp. TaxID=376 RepID=UPI0027357E66|nr:hypothetical protein [Bradyrhizobium sp.]MDP3693426.1 hypothetical protein [Bradyrhizobium sp.]